MRTMRSAVFLLAGFVHLAVFLSAVQLTSATPSPEQPSPRGLDLRYPVVRKRGPATLPDGWSHKGCYIDSDSRRVLTAFEFPNSAMTITLCVSFCNDREQIYAGLENGNVCHCGNVLTVGSTTAPLVDCVGPKASNCFGDPTNKCGASNRLDLYRSSAPEQPPPTIVSPVNSWISQGCFKDSDDNRILPNPASNKGSLTVGLCIDACNGFGFNMAGVEFAKDCWCGSGSLPSGREASNDCVLACQGDSTQICGGSDAIVVYKSP